MNMNRKGLKGITFIDNSPENKAQTKLLTMYEIAKLITLDKQNRLKSTPINVLPMVVNMNETEYF